MQTGFPMVGSIERILDDVSVPMRDAFVARERDTNFTNIEEKTSPETTDCLCF